MFPVLVDDVSKPRVVLKWKRRNSYVTLAIVTSSVERMSLIGHIRFPVSHPLWPCL